MVQMATIEPNGARTTKRTPERRLMTAFEALIINTTEQ